MRRRSPQVQPSAGQDYLASVSDLMSGLIFIFIITLAVFALRLAQAQQDLQQREKEYTDSQEVRDQIIDEITRVLRERGVAFEVDKESGVLRLTDRTIGFVRGEKRPRPEDRDNVAVVAHAVSRVLRCYVVDPGEGVDLASCTKSKGGARVDTVMIEGHTDSIPIANGDNLDLSTGRSARILRLFEEDASEMRGFKNRSSKPVLSVSGYGETRPINKSDTEADENRRIDIRFIMELAKPKAPPPPVPETRREIAR